MRFSCVLLAAAVASGFAAAPAAGADKLHIPVVYIKQATETLPKLSNLAPPPADDGVKGGAQGVADNNTTGQFLGHEYAFSAFLPEGDETPQAVFAREFAAGARLFVMDIGADDLLAIADSEQGKGALFFNIGARDDRLRTAACRANVLHIVPSYTMLADALAQFLVSKKWREWMLVVGRRASDQAYADAVRRAAKKFGAKITAEKPWEYGADMRRLAASTVPVFTQGEDYDVLVVADFVGEFGEYLMYRTWDPRPVAGTQGLVARTWHTSHEQWGAVQMQNRFSKNHGHRMTEKEYGVWSAMRAIGEAVTRSGSAALADMLKYIEGPKFELAGYKGQKMAFRSWNNQLRQPVLLTSDTSLVSVSPQRQFLHERSKLDTMGFDKHQSECRLRPEPA